MYIAMTAHDFDRIMERQGVWLDEYCVYGAETSDELKGLILNEMKDVDSDLRLQDYIILEVSNVLELDVQVHTTVDFKPIQHEE